MIDCRQCKYLKPHPKTKYGYTCVAYENLPDLVIYIPGISEFGCDYYEQKQEADNGNDKH